MGEDTKNPGRQLLRSLEASTELCATVSLPFGMIEIIS